MASLKRLKPWEKAFFLARQKKLDLLKREISSEVFRRGLDFCGAIEAYAELPRAMALLRERLLTETLPNGTVVLARRLWQAKGRFSRNWWAPKGGLWWAMAVYDDFLPEIRGWLPLVFGFAVTQALRNLGAEVYLRWVNDVHYQGQKVAGLLVEEARLGEETWFLVGLGINVNNPLPPGLPAQSLRSLLGKILSLPRVFGEIFGELVRFLGLLRLFEQAILEGEGGENPLARWFPLLSDTPGQKISFGEDLTERIEGEGIALGLDARGGLIVETETGRYVLRSGEVRYS